MNLNALKEIEFLMETIKKSVCFVFYGKNITCNLNDVLFNREEKDILSKIICRWLREKGLDKFKLVEDSFYVLLSDDDELAKKVIYLRNSLEQDLSGEIRECVLDAVADITNQLCECIIRCSIKRWISVEDLSNDLEKETFVLNKTSLNEETTWHVPLAA